MKSPKEQLSNIYVDSVLWCQDLWPSDLAKYLQIAKQENPTKKITVNTALRDIYSETEIENMCDEDRAHYLV